MVESTGQGDHERRKSIRKRSWNVTPLDSVLWLADLARQSQFGQSQHWIERGYISTSRPSLVISLVLGQYFRPSLVIFSIMSLQSSSYLHFSPVSFWLIFSNWHQVSPRQSVYSVGRKVPFLSNFDSGVLSWVLGLTIVMNLTHSLILALIRVRNGRKYRPRPPVDDEVELKCQPSRFWRARLANHSTESSGLTFWLLLLFFLSCPVLAISTDQDQGWSKGTGSAARSANHSTESRGLTFRLLIALACAFGPSLFRM